MEYIEMDESESLGSTVSEETLRLVAAILGPEVKDMLLYPVVEDVLYDIGKNDIIINGARLITEKEDSYFLPHCL